MKEVKCPKCDSEFEMDASGYADIVSQVRGDEFEKRTEQPSQGFGGKSQHET